MVIIEMRADELIPGDRYDTRCGVGDLAFAEIAAVRLIEVNAPGAQDRIEVRDKGDGLSSTRTFLADSVVRVWVTG
jgi:hypothetical protein